MYRGRKVPYLQQMLQKVRLQFGGGRFSGRPKTHDIGVSNGYTIVETLVFLAVSSFMFVAAGVFINGRQAQAEFSQAVNTFDIQLRQAMDDVRNGFYPSGGNFSCNTGLLTGRPTFSAAARDQGTNQNCVFVGKMVQFVPSGTNNTGYNTVTMVGRRLSNNNATEAQNLSQTFPTPLTPAYTGGTGVDSTARQTVSYGVRITRVYHFRNGTSAPLTNVGSIGFTSSFASYTGNNLNAGAQKINLVIPTGTSLNQTEAAAGARMAAINDTNIRNDHQVVICLDGGGNRRGYIAIGSNNAGIATNAQAGGTPPGNGC